MNPTVLACLIKYNRCTCTLAHAACLLMTQRRPLAIFIMSVNTETWYLCKNVHRPTVQKLSPAPTCFHVPLCMLSDTSHTHTHTHTHMHTVTPVTQWIPEHTHGPFAVFLLFSVVRPAVSRLSMCSVARQTAPPPPNNKICL